VRTSHLCNGFLYFRKLLFSLVIVFLYNKEYLQLVLISLLNIVILAYISYVCPYDSRKENIKNGAGEIVLIGI